MSDAVVALLENTVEDVLAQIDDFALPDLELALTMESEGKNRAGIVNGLTKKIEQLTAEIQQAEAKALAEKQAEAETQAEPEAQAEAQKNKAPSEAKAAQPIDGLGRPLTAPSAVKKTNKKGPVDGLGRPL